MTRHLIRLMWNRKRGTILVAAEMLISFLVLSGVTLVGLQAANNWHQPLGFSIDRVWSIEVRPFGTDPASRALFPDTFRELVAALKDLPNVEVVAGANTGPYSGSNWGSGVVLPGRHEVTPHSLFMVTDEFREVVNLRLVAGRWFSREDDAATVQPVVINRRLAREGFGDEDAIGQILEIPSLTPPFEPLRIVGVVEDYRKNGELDVPDNVLFQRLRIGAPTQNDTAVVALPNVILIRVAPGTSAAFEEQLISSLQAIAKDWNFRVRAVEDMRAERLGARLRPLIPLVIVAGFLLLMVALGLTGVVWQSVTERTREFGLRRANGAAAVDVRRQVRTELLILASMALALGLAIVLQIPLLPFPAGMPIFPNGVFAAAVPGSRQIFPTAVFAAAIALSVAAIYLLTLVCAWYPSRLATKIQPAEALHYE